MEEPQFHVYCYGSKEREAEDFKDFRLISLVISLYKLISKVLANRIRKVMSKLVNKAQNAFVDDR